jgi:2-polyprenyl-6-methoxyphenol hydroxylase-like FAD-dependent oxidoreductase
MRCWNMTAATDDATHGAALTRLPVIVAGAGPAGAAVAIRLRSHGLPVTLCDASSGDDPPIGERLTARGARALQRLGVWDAFLFDQHPSSPGIVSVWGSAIPHVADALQDPFGAAWHLDRGRFDRMLRLAAQSAGALVLRDTRVVSAQRTAHNVWTVATNTREQITVRQATVVVDARGRQARDLLGCRVPASSDRLVATAFVFSSPLKDPHCEWTLVEACADGWWYSAPLPNARSSVVFFTDADLHAHRNDVQQLANGTGASLTLDRIPRTQQPMAVVRMPAWSDNRHPSEPVTCVRVGDAAVAYDPLSGAGLCRALETAIDAAEAIAAHHKGDVDALAQYGARLNEAFSSHLASRARFYAVEQRWPQASFWRRRNTQWPFRLKIPLERSNHD